MKGEFMIKSIWQTYVDEDKKRDRKKPKQVNDFPPHLRGFSQNRYGGHQAQNLKTYRGKFGAAGPCRSLSKEEIKHLEDTGQVPGWENRQRVPI
jgi:hypothetical protein